MNIAIVLNHMNRGGLASYVVAAANGLQERGHNVYVLSRGGELQDKVRHFILPIKGKNAFSLHNLSLSRRLVDFVKDNSIDCIWAQTRISAVMGTVASKFSGARLITTAHGFYRLNLGRLLFPCWGQKVIAISRAVCEDLKRTHGVSSDKIVVVYNGICGDKVALLKAKMQQYRPVARQRLGIEDGSVVLGMLARISYAKGHKVALQAIASSSQRHRIKFLFLGKGAEKEEKELNALIKELNLRRNVLWIKEIEDTALFWAGVDAILVPSIEEGLGLTAIEAQLLGVPVIASSAGGLKEVVEEGRTGRMFETGDFKGLAGLLDEFVNKRYDFSLFAENAKRRAEDLFSCDRFISGIESVLKGG